jgi:hypothetical protein
VREAQASGDITTREEALSLVARLLVEQSPEGGSLKSSS